VAAAELLNDALQALERLPETPDTLAQAIDARLELRIALAALGRYQDVLRVMREAESLAARLGDRARLGRILADICARLRNVAGEHLQAIEVGEQAMTIAADTGDRELELEARYRTGQAYFAIGDFRKALELLSRCVERGGRESSQPSILFTSWAHSWLALTLSNLGRFEDARAHAQEALQIAEGADHPFTLAEALAGAGSVSLAQGDLERAFEALERARALIVQWHLQPWAVFARLGYAHVLSARPVEARRLLGDVIEGASTMSAMGVSRAMQLGWLSEAYLIEGLLDEAHAHAQEAVSLARRHGERHHEAWCLRLLGQIVSHRDPVDFEQAEGYYREALSLADMLGARPLAAHCHLHLGELLQRMGRQAPAHEHLGTATRMYREMDMRTWLIRAEIGLREPG
jgi:tetratricopeptide (TPR) repeat protein